MYGLKPVPFTEMQFSMRADGFVAEDAVEGGAADAERATVALL
jgi:hypothetical protein